jgi:hypothetical protein
MATSLTSGSRKSTAAVYLLSITERKATTGRIESFIPGFA